MKTANELQITESEYAALRKTRDLLASGKVVWQNRNVESEFHEIDGRTMQGLADPTIPMLFNMSTIRSGDECHTVACIGGWMAHIMGMTDRWDAVDFVNNKMSPALGLLCFPEPGVMNMIRPEHAVEAIDYFLNTGAPMWYYVLKADPALADETLIDQPKVVNIGNVRRFEEMEEAQYRYIEQSESHRPLQITHKDKADAS